jgi:hypothetical protein
MKQQTIDRLKGIWGLALTPFYLGFLAATSLFVLLALGPKEFMEFWRKNK